MKLLIVQTSPQHTASTLLVNALHGIIQELRNTPVCYLGTATMPREVEAQFKNVILVKTHDSISKFRALFKNKYNLLFVCSERKEKGVLINNEYRSQDDVVIFDYDELNETPTLPLSAVINTIYTKIKEKLPGIRLNPATGVERIVAMNKRFEEIKHLPFKYVDSFFQIHGSHRNRGKPPEAQAPEAQEVEEVEAPEAKGPNPPRPEAKGKPVPREAKQKPAKQKPAKQKPETTPEKKKRVVRPKMKLQFNFWGE